MMDLLILPVGLLAGVVAWIVFCAVANWIETGHFKAVRRG